MDHLLSKEKAPKRTCEAQASERKRSERRAEILFLGLS